MVGTYKFLLYYEINYLVLFFVYMAKVQKKIIAADIVQEGRTILKECRDFRKKFKDTPMTEENFKDLHKQMTEKHHDFASIYMLPLRTIVYNNEYYDDVMESYINFLTKNPWKDRRTFIEHQAHYMVLLYRRKHPRHGSKDVARYKEMCIKNLVEEDETFKKWEKEVKETVEAEFDQLVEDRRKRIYDKLIKMKESKEKGEEIDENAEKEEVQKLMSEIQNINDMKELMDKRAEALGQK